MKTDVCFSDRIVMPSAMFMIASISFVLDTEKMYSVKKG